LREAGDEVRVAVVRSARPTGFSFDNGSSSISFQVCVSAILDEKSFGEYLHHVGERVGYFEDQVRARVFQVERDIRKEIEVAGKVVKPGRYVCLEDRVYGAKQVVY
jgi:hypothetical protein